MDLSSFLYAHGTSYRPACWRGTIVTLVSLSLLVVPGAVAAGAQDTASPAASPVVSAEAQFIARFDAEAGEFSEGVTVAADGTVYASLSPLGQLVRLGPGEGEYEVVGTVEGVQEGDFGLIGISAHADGSVYGAVVSANPAAHGVWRIDVDTGNVELVPGTGQIALPNSIVFDGDGTMYVTDAITGAVWTAAPGGTAEQWLQHELLVGTGSLGNPFPVGANGIALDDASDTIYVAVLEQSHIVTIPIEADGAAGEPAIHIEFGNGLEPAMPDGITFDAAGNLYVALTTLNTVVRVTPDGTVETVAIEADGMDGPTSVAIGQNADGAERLYVANFSVALAPHVPPGGAGPGIVMIELGG